MHATSLNYTSRVLSYGNTLDIFDIFGGCRYPTTTCFTATHKKRGYSHWELCVSSRRLPNSVSTELGVSVCDRAWIHTVDCVGLRNAADCSILWFFLLLSEVVAQQRTTLASYMMNIAVKYFLKQLCRMNILRRESIAETVAKSLLANFTCEFKYIISVHTIWSGLTG